MMTQSGCFGRLASDNDTIDNVEEVSAAVDGIVVEGGQGTTCDDPTTIMLAQRCVCMEQQLRLLTWAVVALVVMVFARETLTT